MKLSIKVGATSQTVNIFIQDSSSTTGAGLTGLVYNTASLVAYYALTRAAAVSITLATLAAITTAWSSGGFKEVDATNMPGWYRLDIPDAALASGRFVAIHLKGATNMAPLPIEIELTGWDNQDGVRGGLTALPNAAAEAAGGLYTRGSGAGQINQDANGRVDVNLKATLGTTSTGAAGYVGLDWGQVTNKTTTNALTGTTIATSQVVASVSGAVGSVTGLTASDVGAIKTKTDFLPSATAGAAGGVFIAGTNAATTVTTSFTTTFTGNLTGSVASVTGAVGSVTAGVTVTTNNDKTGYSLTQSFPANFSSMLINGSGLVTYSNTAPPTAAANATAVWGATVEGAFTYEGYMRLTGSALFGKLSGISSNLPVFRDTADSKNRISATQTADGRTAVTLDAS